MFGNRWGPKKKLFPFPLEESLNVENTMWANTVVASGTACGMVIYTGNHTRSVMNTSTPRSKFGLLDRQVNNLSKILLTMVLGLSLTILLLKGLHAYHVLLLKLIIQ